jgi:hypothetical protein
MESVGGGSIRGLWKGGGRMELGYGVGGGLTEWLGL